MTVKCFTICNSSWSIGHTGIILLPKNRKRNRKRSQDNADKLCSCVETSNYYITSSLGKFPCFLE